MSAEEQAGGDVELDYGGDEHAQEVEQTGDAPMEHAPEHPAGDAMDTVDAKGAEAAAEPAAAAEQPAAPTTAGQQPSAQEHPADPTSADHADPMSQPPHGTEVFMGGIPNEASEAAIKEFASQAGEVYNLRVPRDHVQNTNKGFAFVVYTTQESADKACATLNGTKMRDYQHRTVKVIPSNAKNKLFVGAIPNDMTKEQVVEAFKAEVQGVTDLELMMSKDGTNSNRGFGFLEFYNHAAADKARKHLTDTNFKLGTRYVTVSWAEPKRTEVPAEALGQVKSIYVGGIPGDATQEQLTEIFKKYGTVDKVIIPPAKEGEGGKPREYAFVHYADRETAERACAAAKQDSLKLGDRELTVAMAKPQLPAGGLQPGFGVGPGRGAYPSHGYQAGRGAPGRGPPGRGAGRGYGAGRGRGYEGYGYESYGYDDSYSGSYDSYGYEEGYEGYGGYGGYGSYSGGGALVPMMMPNGQMAYMMTSTGAGAARRTGGYQASTGYAASGGYSAGRGSPAAGRGAGRGPPPSGGAGYTAGGRGSSYAGGRGGATGYGAPGGSGGRYHPYGGRQ